MTINGSSLRTAAGIVVMLLLISSARASNTNSLMDISSDGRLLACSNRDSGTVTIVDLQSHAVAREVPVGAKPEGVSFVGASHRLAVAVYGEDKVLVLDADSGKRLGRVDVFDEPYGIVSDRGGERLFVSLDYPGSVVEIDMRSLKIVRTLPVGKFARGIALTGSDAEGKSEDRLLVSEFYTSRVVALDLKTGKQVDQWTGGSTDNLSRQIALHPRRGKAYVPHIRSRVNVAHGSGSIFPYISILDTPAGPGKRRTRIPMDVFQTNLVTANPWEIAVAPDGRQLYVVFAGTNDMFACNVLDDDYEEIENRRYVRLGANPRAVRVAPDNATVYVYNALDFNVVAYDAKSMREKAKISVTDSPLSAEVLRGKLLFYSALQPMVGRRWISCSSCHPDGEADGRTWHNPEGLRNTQSFAGMAWTHPIHWSADRDEVQDFEHTIRGKLMQGRGLIEGRLSPQLGPANGGRSEKLDALAAYANSHKFALSPHAKGGLTAAASRGRELFLSKKTGCATCHSGPLCTDSKPRSPAEIVRHDVGTGLDDPGEKMGPAYDTPTLLGIYRTAPYLHHGKATTLEEVLTSCNPNDTHGTTSHLSKQQVADLVSFLKSLPYEDPLPAARSAGLTDRPRAIVAEPKKQQPKK